MAKRRIKRVAVKQMPRESTIPGNKRVTALSGRTTWWLKMVQGTLSTAASY